MLSWVAGICQSTTFDCNSLAGFHSLYPFVLCVLCGLCCGAVQCAANVNDGDDDDGDGDGNGDGDGDGDDDADSVQQF